MAVNLVGREVKKGMQIEPSPEVTWNAGAERSVVQHRHAEKEEYLTTQTALDLLISAPDLLKRLLDEKGYKDPKPPLTQGKIKIGMISGKTLARGANAAIMGLSVCVLAALVASVAGNSIMQAAVTGLQRGAELGLILPLALLVMRGAAGTENFKDHFIEHLTGRGFSEMMTQREMIRDSDTIQKCTVEFFNFYTNPSKEALLVGSALILMMGIVVGLSS